MDLVKLVPPIPEPKLPDRIEVYDFQGLHLGVLRFSLVADSTFGGPCYHCYCFEGNGSSFGIFTLEAIAAAIRKADANRGVTYPTKNESQWLR